MPWHVGDYVTEGDKPFDQGSFGTVWRGRRRSDGAPVALKLVLLTDAVDAGERIAAERHGAMLQQQFEQAHGMVPKVYDFGYDAESNLYIAMELVEGGSLAEEIKRGTVAPESAARYAAGICAFLDRAHGFATTIEGEPYDRIVHGDLKPGHILIAPSGAVKVLDFGIAKALARTTQVTTNNWGTSAYASPERLDCGHVNEHADFWSLGVILYEMVSGSRPYLALERHRGQLETAIRTNAPRQALPSSCPDGLAAIVTRLMAYQIERRYPTAAAIKQDLERYLAGEKPAALDEYVIPPTVPIGRSLPRRPLMPAIEAVPPTDPLPAPAVAGRTPGSEPAVDARPPRRLGTTLARAARVAALLVLIGLTAAEGATWVATERFRDTIATIEGRSLVEAKRRYDRILSWSVLDAWPYIRIRAPLKRRLVTLADGVITDYRREDPTMGPAEWRQADLALRWAVELSARDAGVVAKQLLAEGHVIRFTARGQSAAAARQTYRRAMDRFEAAARQDTASFDPYLGISRIQVYGLGDVDRAATAIEEAARRGYAPGRREQALLGDGYARRADSGRALARTLSGEQRRREMEKARADYVRCVDAFDPIVGFGRAAQNMESCKRQLERLDRELAIDDKRRGA